MENQKMKDIKYIIADNVKLYRKKQNLTQFELAEKAELSVDSIKRIEHGSRTMSLENFMRIADALDVPLSFLVYENLNKIPITERTLNILNIKSEKQQEYLLHMLEEAESTVPHDTPEIPPENQQDAPGDDKRNPADGFP